MNIRWNDFEEIKVLEEGVWVKSVVFLVKYTTW